MTAGLLRPGLELAWAVARVGEDSSPPIPAPGAVRKLLRFSRLPDRALATLRRVVESDEAFRGRVAEAATEAVVGRPAWLWLRRPEGWESELAGLVEEATRSASSAREEHEERSARRRLAAAEEARRRADAAAAAAGETITRAAEDLSAERQARRAAEARVGSLEAQMAALEAQLPQSLARAEAAEQVAQRLRDADLALVAERDRLLVRVAELERELLETRRRLEAQLIDVQGRLDLAASPGSGRDSAAAKAVAEAAGAARQLGEALAAAAEALTSGDEPDGGSSAARMETAPASPPAATAGAKRPRVHRSRPPRRRPAPLPPAVFDDSSEAAEHLVRVPGMILLVDGYNVSLQAWPDVPIPEQRRRLVDALSAVAARTGVDAQVIFDGAEQPEPRSSGLPPRSAVRVRFSPPDVDADEVLIELTEELPPARPVTVATSDRRVQEEVRKRGATVISALQMLGVLGRAQ